jgi:tetratricopeptide (TPR) repeat protein
MSKSENYFQITKLLAAGDRDAAELILNRNREQLSYSEYQECLGNRHFYAKQFQEAIPYYETALSSSSEYDCARYHYLLGIQAERSGNLTESFKRYQAAIEIEPSFVDAYIELGGLLAKVEDFEGSLQCYADALRLDTLDLAIHLNLVQVLKKLAQRDADNYSEKLQHAQAEYDRAKQLSDAPAKDRVW